MSRRLRTPILALATLLFLGTLTTYAVAWIMLHRQWQPIQLAKARREFASMRFIESNSSTLIDNLSLGDSAPSAPGGAAAPKPASSGGAGSRRPTALAWPCPVPADWPITPRDHGEDAVTGIRRATFASFIDAGGGTHVGFGAWLTADEITCGWPFLCIRGVRCQVPAPPTRLVTTWPSQPASYGVIILRDSDAEPAPTKSPAWLPYGVRPGPFIASTLIYAAAWATIWAMALGLTRVLRRFKRRPWMCRTCRYDLTGLAQGAPCPECGQHS